jgi:putative component of membrane protein insertase Oxa1/YidC/SpoIIIJ protein YidD
MSKIFIELITFYQRYLSFDTGLLRILAPGGACKYSPTCSEYTKQMIMKHGVIKGVGMGAKRVWSCR